MDDPAREPNPPRRAGLLLAGGRSRRFGAEKAVAFLAGRTLLDWSLKALGGVCEVVAVSAPLGSAAFAAAAAAGHDVLPDEPGHPAGPLAGIAAGLAWARERGFGYLATLPCDTPLVTSAEIVALGLPSEGVGAVFAATAEAAQPLCAIWRTDQYPILAALLAEGRHPPVKAFLAAIHAAPVCFDEAAVFADADTREALAALESDAASRRRPI